MSKVPEPLGLEGRTPDNGRFGARHRLRTVAATGER